MSKLVLGWTVNRELDPHSARVGLNAPKVEVSADRIDKHMAVVAQSGSGKSFFLGRYVEELLLRTRARCVVLDPNGDFSQLEAVEPTTPWGLCEYDFEKKRGRMTHEGSEGEFLVPWQAIPKQVLMSPEFASRSGATPIAIHWPSVSAGLVAPDYDPARLHEVKDCHRMSQSLSTLLGILDPQDARELLPLSREMLLARDDSALKSWLTAHVNRDRVEEARTEALCCLRGITKPSKKVRDYLKEVAKSDVRLHFETIRRLHGHTPEDSKKYYLSRSESICQDPIFSRSVVEQPKGIVHRAEVVDLSSIADEGTRLLAVNAMIRRCWQDAISDWRDALVEHASEGDKRVPMFIVIDEAHNIVPSEPRSIAAKFVREQIRKIAAEGRKYGLFLVLVSQRPDKLDPLVLSECENRVLMRVGSESVLNMTRVLLGLEDVPLKVLNRVVDYPTGRGLLVGSWIDETYEVFYAQARRTKEGGKGLDSSYWSEPEESPAMANSGRPKLKNAGTGRRKAKGV